VTWSVALAAYREIEVDVCRDCGGDWRGLGPARGAGVGEIELAEALTDVSRHGALLPLKYCSSTPADEFDE
jgi:hypothetical protein